MGRCILLDISSVFCKNHIFGILAIIFACFGFCEVLRAFFLHVLRYQFETCYIHSVGSVTRQVRVAFQSGHFDLLYSKKLVKVIFLHSWPQKLYIGLRFGVLTSTDFLHGWAIFGFLADKTTRRGELVELPASEIFSRLYFNMLWDINLKLCIYI